MSHGFGQQFSDARKAKSISLKEASEALKIREEYLSDIEKGRESWDLPDIYVRGFIKIYAQYLGLDVDKVLNECPIKEFDVLDNEAGKNISYEKIVKNSKEQDNDGEEVIDDSVKFSERMKNFVEKIKKISVTKTQAIIAIMTFTIVVLFITTLSFGLKRQPRTERHSTHVVRQGTKISDITEHVLSLISTGNVKVVVRSKKTGDKLFAGKIEPGNIEKISYSEPIQIFYDKGEYLIIKRQDGEQLPLRQAEGALELD